jgi:WD40 repeat protein
VLLIYRGRPLRAGAVGLDIVGLTPEGEMILAGVTDRCHITVWAVEDAEPDCGEYINNNSYGGCAQHPSAPVPLGSGCTGPPPPSCSMRELVQLQGHDNMVVSMSFSFDGKYLVTSSCMGGDCLVWDLATYTLKHKLNVVVPLKMGIYPVAFNAVDYRIVYKTGPRQFVIADAELNLLLAICSFEERFECFALSPDGNDVAFGRDTQLVIWDGMKNIPKFVSAEGQQVQERICFVQYSPNGKLIATLTTDGIIVWDTISKQRNVKIRGCWERPYIEFLNDSSDLLIINEQMNSWIVGTTNSLVNEVVLHESCEPRLLGQIGQFTGTCTGINYICKNNAMLLYGTNQKRELGSLVQLYDMNTGKVLCKYRCEQLIHEIRCNAFGAILL